MANLVTNLGGQEGGQVGLESLLQTYEKMKEQKIYLILRYIFFYRGQRMASELSANNPDLIESLRRNMPNQQPPNNDNSSSSN